MKTRIPYVLAALLATAVAMNLTAAKEHGNAPSLLLETLNGQSTDLRQPHSDLLLLQFWSTSCSICVRDVSVLNQLQAEHNRQQLQLLAVAMPYDKQTEIETFIEKRGVRYPIAFDAQGIASDAFSDVRFTPTSYLIDASGQIVWRHVGQLQLSQVRSQIAYQLNSSSQNPPKIASSQGSLENL